MTCIQERAVQTTDGRSRAFELELCRRVDQKAFILSSLATFV